MGKTQKENFSFKNIEGNKLQLKIQEVSHCLKITIVNCKKGLYRKCILLFIIASIDLVFLVFNIFPINVILAILCLTLALLYAICNITIEENLVVIKDLGIEVATIQVVGVKKVFFPQEQVQRIFINEVIFRNKVLFVLTLLTKDFRKNDKLVPLFTDIFPQLALLKVVYSYINNTL